MNSSIGGAAPETASAGKTEAYVKDQMHDLTRGLRDKLRRRLHAISDRLEEMKERQDNVVQSRSERFRSHFDIVGSLPLEIVLQIVTCLDPEDIARSRRVRMPFFFLFFSFEWSSTRGYFRSHNNGSICSRAILSPSFICAKPLPS